MINTLLMKMLIIYILFGEGFIILGEEVFIIIKVRLIIITLRLQWVLVCLVGNASILNLYSVIRVFTSTLIQSISIVISFAIFGLYV